MNLVKLVRMCGGGLFRQLTVVSNSVPLMEPAVSFFQRQREDSQTALVVSLSGEQLNRSGG